jgi:Ca2+/Na+ antiporter
MITGLASVIHPLTITQFTQTYSFPWLMVFVVVVILMLRKDGTLVTREGGILLTLYVLYIAGLVVLSMIGLS